MAETLHDENVYLYSPSMLVLHKERHQSDICDCGGLHVVLGFVFHCADVVFVGENLHFCFLPLFKNADLCAQCVIWNNIKVWLISHFIQ